MQGNIYIRTDKRAVWPQFTVIVHIVVNVKNQGYEGDDFADKSKSLRC